MSKQKIKFKKHNDGCWWPDENNKALIWQQGVLVTHITDTAVMLGSVREPLGSQPRDEKIDTWLNDNIEWIEP